MNEASGFRSFASIKRFGFGEAIQRLKNGEVVARKSWRNGKGMWLTYVEADAWCIKDEMVSVVSECEGHLPFIAMKTVEGKIVPWLASQTDMLADDWVVVRQAKAEDRG